VRIGGNDVAEHPTLGIRALGHFVPVIAGNDDDVASTVGPAHDSDVTAVPASGQYDNGSDPRRVDAVAVVEEGLGRARIGGGMTGAAQNEVDEVGAPEVGIRNAH